MEEEPSFIFISSVFCDCCEHGGWSVDVGAGRVGSLKFLIVSNLGLLIFRAQASNLTA